MRDIIELYGTLLCQLRYITMRMSPIRDAFSQVFHTRLRFRTRSGNYIRYQLLFVRAINELEML